MFELVLVFVVGYAVFCTEHVSVDVVHSVSIRLKASCVDLVCGFWILKRLFKILVVLVITQV